MSKSINVLSLFDGMSCGQIALNRAGFKINEYYASEIDKYAIKVTLANYPNTIQLGSVEWVDEIVLPKIDLLIGGSPCQGLSFIGKQLNFNDSRSKLFFEFVRLFEVLKKENPGIKFLLENVRMSKESQDVISKYLGVEPILINSTLVSGQNRNRLYWTNIRGIDIPKDKGIVLGDILESEGFGVIKNRGELQLRKHKSMCLDANYFKGVDNHGQRTMIVEGPETTDLDTLTYRKLTPVECERLQTVPDNYTSSVSNSQRYKMLGNGWTVDVISHIFSSWKQN